MKTFAVKVKRSAPAIRRSQPSRFGYRGPEVQTQQAKIRRILRYTGAQAKLTVGQPNDKYEQEADRVADHVMRMSDADVAQRQPENEEEELQAKLKGEILQREEENEEDESVQVTATPGQITQVSSNVESRINSLKGGGQPLEKTSRNFFEPRFGYDFSRVRVHQGGLAADVSHSISARAFTLGNNIVFDAGQYQPQSTKDKRLMAHELAHVVKQNGGVHLRRKTKWKGTYGDPKEMEKVIKDLMAKRKITRSEAEKLLKKSIKGTGEAMEKGFPGLADKKYSYDVLQDIIIGPDRRKPNCFGDVCKGGTQRWEPTESELNAWLSKEGYTELSCSGKTIPDIAVYIFHGKFNTASVSQPTHIAERLSDGRWRSRMGDMGVIFHERPDQVLSQLQDDVTAEEVAAITGKKVISSKMEMKCYSRKKPGKKK